MRSFLLACLVAIASAVALIVLSGCGHARPVAVLCPAVKPYTPAEQRALAEALRPLAESSPLVWAMADYGALRAAARACKTEDRS